MDEVTHDQALHIGIWGDKVEPLTDDIEEWVKATFGLTDLEEECKRVLSREQEVFPITLPEPTLGNAVVEELAAIADLHFTTDPLQRLKHSVGKSYYDILRLRNGRLTHFADAVVSPITTHALERFLEVAKRERITVTPAGGRTAVTEAFEPVRGGVVVDLLSLNKVVKFEPDNCLVRVEAGILFPALEDWLGKRGFKLGHSPQSFMLASVGGTIAARGSGQHCALYGPMEQLVQDVTVLTPRGTFNHRSMRTPKSAVGPDLSRLFIGSEGALGLITHADLRITPVQDIDYKAFLYKNFEDGLDAVREIYQRHLRPATIRLSDPEETDLFMRLGSDSDEDGGVVKYLFRTVGKMYIKRRGYGGEHKCLMVTHYEGDEELVRTTKERVTDICKSHDAMSLGQSPGKTWYDGRYDLPYLRESLLRLGLLVDTLETATTWENLTTLYTACIANLKKYCPVAMAHVSHIYPQGASLYFTFIASEDFNWDEPLIQRIRRSHIETVLKNGGTISHHHGVGQAFHSFVSEERPPLARGLLQELKSYFDPDGIMNPASGFV